MTRTQSRTPRATRAARKVLAVTAAALVLLSGFAAPAAAADESITVSITAVAPVGGTTPTGHVLSGVTQAFRVGWECSGSNGACQGGKIEVPVPLGQPGNIPLLPADISSIQIDGQVVGQGQLVGSAPNQKIVWTFPQSVPTGKSGTLTFTLLPHNSVTPDGTTMTPQATFSASNVPTPVTASTTVIVDAESGLKTRKFRIAPTEDPWLDQNVTYRILIGYPQQFSPIQTKNTLDIGSTDYCKKLGVQALQDLVVVDTLPPGAVFVEASNGGVHNAGTVTWNIGSTVKPDATALSGWSCGGIPDHVTVTVRYPKPTFTAGEEVVNSVAATAAPWLRPDEPLSSSDAVDHTLRDSGTGEFTVTKQSAYYAAMRDDRVSWRGDNSRDLFHFAVSSKGAAAGRWTMSDVLPCGLTSPTDPNATDCAAPAITDLRFSADAYLPELHVNYVTNKGSTGVCVIPAGASVTSDERLCEGKSDKSDPLVASVDGEWITKIWLDEDLPPATSGKLYVFGKVNPQLPLTNDDVDYQYSGVSRTADDPRLVTIENCTVDNTVTWPGGSRTTNGQAIDPNAGGRCGYFIVGPDPLIIESEKRMYTPQASTSQQAASPNVGPNTVLRVEFRTQRSWWDTDYALVVESGMTPVFEDILPANLEVQPGTTNVSVRKNSGEATPYQPDQVLQDLGSPHTEITDVVIDGETRQKVRITFPDATPQALKFAFRLSTTFDVLVKPGTPDGRYTNNLSSSAEELPGMPLECINGERLDADGNPTTDYTSGASCRLDREYSILPIPGVSVSKQVQGSYDAAFVSTPGVGSTDKSGEATYRVPVLNSGSVALTDVIVYDMLPRVGDSDIKPGSIGSRGSQFDVHLSGPVSVIPVGATVLYSTTSNPCRGELSGNGTGSRDSAPAGCADDWKPAAQVGSWDTVTAIRFDLGSTDLEAGDVRTFEFPAVAGDGDLTGVAWNNVAVAATEAAVGTPILPTEASKVGLQLIPDMTWAKVDGVDGTLLLGGSEWTLTPVLAAGEQPPAGTWPRTVVDCTIAGECHGEDQDPAEGRFALKGVPWGTYDLVETKAPEGYVVSSDPIRVVVGPGNLDETTWIYPAGDVKNFKPGPDLSWDKVDPESALLAGSQWELVALDGTGAPAQGGLVISVADCVAGSATLCTGPDRDPAAGKFTLEQVPPGVYHLIETQAPPGFKKLIDPIVVNVSGSTAVSIGEIENEQITVPALPMTGGLGTFIFTITGGALLALTLLLAMRTARRRKLS